MRLELPGDFDSRRRIEAAMHLNQYLHVWADRIADRLHQPHGADLFRSIQLIEPGAEWVQLERTIALPHDSLGGGVELFGGPLDRVPPVRVCLDAVAHSAP